MRLIGRQASDLRDDIAGALDSGPVNFLRTSERSHGQEGGAAPALSEWIIYGSSFL